MYKSELNDKSKDELIELIRTMGFAIRHLDEDNQYLDYWSNDDEEELSQRAFELRMSLMTDKFYGDNSFK